MALNLISDPGRFFEELKGKEISLKVPLLIILVLSIIGGINQFLITIKLAEAFPSDFAGIVRLGAYIGFIGSFAVMMIVWVAVSAIMHVISSYFGGQGLFKRTLEFTGYGFMPSILASAITTAVGAQYIASARVPKLSMTDIQSGEFVNEIMSTMLPADFVYFSIIVSLAFGVWSLTIWTFGLKHARGLSTRNAAITVLLPFLAYVGYTAYTLWGYI
ncbi:MAG: YIP1 family protein [Archaeoglobaceae archaeon]